MRKLGPYAVVAVVLLLVLLPLVLHFGQKHHNEITIPPPPGDQAYAPGAYFGNAAARIIEHELSGTTGWRPNDLLVWGPRVAADNKDAPSFHLYEDRVIRHCRDSNLIFEFIT